MADVASRGALRRPTASATPAGAALSIPRKWKAAIPAKEREGTKAPTSDCERSESQVRTGKRIRSTMVASVLKIDGRWHVVRDKYIAMRGVPRLSRSC